MVFFKRKLCDWAQKFSGREEIRKRKNRGPHVEGARLFEVFENIPEI